MGKYSELLRKEIEAHEVELRAEIGELGEAGLVAWCKKELDSNRDGFKWGFDIKSMISHSSTFKEQLYVRKLSRECHEWRNALIDVVRERRTNGEPIPECWRYFLLDFFLGIEEGPDGRGKKTQSLRNGAICRCIWSIQRVTKYKASRNEASVGACGISIVAEALGDKTGYAGVERVWKERDKHLWPVR